MHQSSYPIAHSLETSTALPTHMGISESCRGKDLYLQSHTLPLGADCSSCTLKSNAARSLRSCTPSIPKTRSGNKKRWSIPSWGPWLFVDEQIFDIVRIIIKREHRTHEIRIRTCTSSLRILENGTTIIAGTSPTLKHHVGRVQHSSRNRRKKKQ